MADNEFVSEEWAKTAPIEEVNDWLSDMGVCPCPETMPA